MAKQNLALFDLDHTLIDGDSDHAWGEFLAAKGLVDSGEHRQANNKFMEDYKAGHLDMMAYLEFALKPLADHDRQLLESHREEFIESIIKPMVLPKARELVNRHRDNGDFTMMITSTNSFVTEPIAFLLGVEKLIATDPEEVDGKFTGKVEGKPSFQQGKVDRLHEWMKDSGHDMNGSFFYSDSHNDIPLLEEVSRPIAVDPDDQLRQHAAKNGWEIISLR